MNTRAGLLSIIALGIFLGMHAHAQTHTVGDTICFTVAAINAQGDTIRDWNTTGSPCTVALEHSTANSDTSLHSWNADPDGYTWAELLHNGVPLLFVPPSLWTLPNTFFVDGKVELCLVHTKADTGVRLSLCPSLRTVKTSAGPFDFDADEVANIMVDVTSSIPTQDAVYLLRNYEVMVVPQDRYTNSVSHIFVGKFHAGYEQEFEFNPNVDYFNGPVYIDGPTQFFFKSIKARTVADPQWLSYSIDLSSIEGVSDPYAVLRHAPEQFYLQSPPEGTVVSISDTSGTLVFDWEAALDPYRNVPISRFTSEIGNDTVRYLVTFYRKNQFSLKYTYEADSAGLRNRLTITLGELHRFVHNIGAPPMDLLWTVEASDGDYQTIGSVQDSLYQIPAMLFRVTQEPNAVTNVPYIPEGITLYQNYPNPVRAAQQTSIRFETNRAGHVLLSVYDLLGNEIAVLADEHLAPGLYNADLATSKLSPGVYLYKLQVNGVLQTRSMVVTK